MHSFITSHHTKAEWPASVNDNSKVLCRLKSQNQESVTYCGTCLLNTAGSLTVLDLISNNLSPNNQEKFNNRD